MWLPSWARSGRQSRYAGMTWTKMLLMWTCLTVSVLCCHHHHRHHHHHHPCYTITTDMLIMRRCCSATTLLSAQTKIASTEDEALRALMTEQKTLAVDLYGRLQAFLEFENDIRGPLKSCLRELNSLAGARMPQQCVIIACMCLCLGPVWFGWGDISADNGSLNCCTASESFMLLWPDCAINSPPNLCPCTPTTLPLEPQAVSAPHARRMLARPLPSSWKWQAKSRTSCR